MNNQVSNKVQSPKHKGKETRKAPIPTTNGERAASLLCLGCFRSVVFCQPATSGNALSHITACKCPIIVKLISCRRHSIGPRLTQGTVALDPSMVATLPCFKSIRECTSAYTYLDTKDKVAVVLPVEQAILEVKDHLGHNEFRSCVIKSVTSSGEPALMMHCFGDFL